MCLIKHKHRKINLEEKRIHMKITYFPYKAPYTCINKFYETKCKVNNLKQLSEHISFYVSRIVKTVF